MNLRDLQSALEVPAEQAARRLLGSYLVRTIEGQRVVGKIVETEAYDQSDAASHSFKGKTPRTEVMFGPAGHLYVYFTYGMHYCCNIVCGPAGTGSAVLLRAIEPVEGEDIMRSYRRDVPGVQITNGPAKLCQALAINKEWNGHDLSRSPLELIIKPSLPKQQIIQTTRIGISSAVDTPWRFYIRDNKYVSRPL